MITNTKIIHGRFAEGLQVLARPVDTDMGVKSLSPFTISVTAGSGNYEDIMLDVYASNSKSIPYTKEHDNNWSKLKPQWRVTDTDDNPLDGGRVEVDYETELKDEHGNIVGAIGIATFYYIDDLPSNDGVPVMIHVTLDSLEYQSTDGDPLHYNSKMRTIIPLAVFPIKPSFLHFSENGTFELSDIKWAGREIKSYATIHGVPRDIFIDNFECAIDYPIIFNAPYYDSRNGSNILDYTIAPLLSSEMELGPSGEEPKFNYYAMGSGIANGGWVETKSTGLVESPSVILSGSVDIELDPSIYRDVTESSSLWIIDTFANEIHNLKTLYIDHANQENIDFYEINGDDIQAPMFDTIHPFEATDKTDYDNPPHAKHTLPALSGYDPKVGVAIDKLGNIWTTSFYDDKVEKRSNTGQLLFSIDLLTNINMPDHYMVNSSYARSFGPCAITIDNDGDAYVALWNSPSCIKISSNGTVANFHFTPFQGPAPTPGEPPIYAGIPPEGSDVTIYYRPIDIAIKGKVLYITYSNVNKGMLYGFDPKTGDTKGMGYIKLSSMNTDDQLINDFTVNFREPNELGTAYILHQYDISKSTYTNIRKIYRIPLADSNFLDDSYYPDPRIIAENLPLAKFITTDRDGNIWFSFFSNDRGKYAVGVIPEYEYNVTNFKYFAVDLSKQYRDILLPPSSYMSNVNEIGGISCDEYGYINVIDKLGNAICRQPMESFLADGIDRQEKTALVSSITVSPTGSYGYSTAFGDWTGYSFNRRDAESEYSTYGLGNSRKSPYILLNEDPTSIDILWQLESGTPTCNIVWGLNEFGLTQGSSVESYGVDSQYKFTITNLTPNSKYYYRVIGYGEGSFISPPKPEATTLRFFAYGDTRGNSNSSIDGSHLPIAHNNVLKEVIPRYEDHPSLQTLILHCGDWVYNGSEEYMQDQYFDEDFRSIAKTRGDLTILGARGNHEVSSHYRSPTFFKYFPYEYDGGYATTVIMPSNYTFESPYDFYRSFDYGPIHVIILDQYADPHYWNEQMEWLDEDLTNSTKLHNIIVLHEPGWSATNGHPPNENVRNDIHPLCIKHGVKIVLGGHNHMYARCNVSGVQHITTGGGGAKLVDVNRALPYVVTAKSVHHYMEFAVDGNALQFTVFDTDNNRVIDTYKTGSDSIGDIKNQTERLIGSSTPFALKSFNDSYDIRRYNDSWDMHSQIKSYIIPDYQKEFTSLWDDLIGNTVGNATSSYQTFGRQFYEKIANFVVNHSDIDLANISQAYSIFESLSLDYDNYDLNYPADIGHWMNILSIVFERLKGSAILCNRNFKPRKFENIEACEVCGQIHATNMGDLIPSPTMRVGQPVVIRDTYKTENSFDVFYPPVNGSYQILSDHYGYRTPFDTNYEVFEYIDTVSPNVQAEGFINWADPHNEIAISGISLQEWWGDGGYATEILTNKLYRGLGIESSFTTDEQSQDNWVLNLLGRDLELKDITRVYKGVVPSEYVLPLKSALCSPVANYGLPCYTATEPITDPKPIKIDHYVMPIHDGVMHSGKYLELSVGPWIVYIPLYAISVSLNPVYGTGLSFSDRIVTPDRLLISWGFILFDNDGEEILLPLYY